MILPPIVNLKRAAQITLARREPQDVEWHGRQTGHNSHVRGLWARKMS